MQKSSENVLSEASRNLLNQIQTPEALLKPLKIRSKLLMIPGPTNITDRVIASASLPIVSHMDPQFLNILKEISSGIRYVFQTKNEYSLAITGSATCAMETAISNLLERGDKLLVLIHGLWGERVAIIGKKHDLNVIQVRVNRIGETFDIKQIEDSVRINRPKLMYVCHGDSSIGTLQPLDGIGSICHKYNCLLLVDAVVSLCCSTINMDVMEIDAIFSGAQKALSGPPGVSILSLSDRAIHVIKNRKTESDSYYMDINWLSKAWGIDNDNKFIYHYTPAMTLLYGLREALSLVAEEGLADLIARHLKYSLIVQKEIESMGLKLFVDKPEHRLPGILSIAVSDNIDAEYIRQYLSDFYDISISGGIGPTVGKILRIGILGVNANLRSVTILCHALREALNNRKHQNISKL